MPGFVPHLSPFTYSEWPGTVSEVEVIEIGGEYSEMNLPSVAFAPASEAFFGLIVITPLPAVVKPPVALVLAARFGCSDPHISTAKPTCQVVPTAG